MLRKLFAFLVIVSGLAALGTPIPVVAQDAEVQVTAAEMAENSVQCGASPTPAKPHHAYQPLGTHIAPDRGAPFVPTVYTGIDRAHE